MLYKIYLNQFFEFFIATDLRAEKVATFLAERLHRTVVHNMILQGQTEVNMFLFWFSTIIVPIFFFVSALFEKLLPKNRNLCPLVPQKEVKYARISGK